MSFLTKYKLVHLVSINIIISCSYCLPACSQKPGGGASPILYNVWPFYKYRDDGKVVRVMGVYVRDYKGPVDVKIAWNSITDSTRLIQDQAANNVLLPAGLGEDSATTMAITITAGDQKLATNVTVPPQRKWTIYIYPHSHLDIGYTGLPEDVLKLQTRNIDVGIDIAEKTQHYPEGSRFVWIQKLPGWYNIICSRLLLH